MNSEEIIKGVFEIVRNALPALDVQVFLFGSRAEGTHQESSDYDFLIKSPKPIESHILTQIKSNIDELRTLASIDIVDIHSVSDDFKRIAMKQAKEIVDGRIRP